MTSNQYALANKFTSDYYQKLVQESTLIQEQLSEFNQKLIKSIHAKPIHDISLVQFSVKEMQDLKTRVSSLKLRIIEKIQRQCSIISQVTNCIKTISHQYKLLIKVCQQEEERGQRNLMDLESQLRMKQIDIRLNQESYQRQKVIILKQQWRKLHYVGNKIIDTQQIPGLAYIKILNDIKFKIQDKIAYEKKENSILSYNINCKLKDFKIKLLNVWYLLPYFFKEQYTFGLETSKKRSTINRAESLEHLYLQKEKEIDEFKVSKLTDIKKKLRLLQQAEMSQSQQFLSCKKSVNGDSKSFHQELQESSVVELFNS